MQLLELNTGPSPPPGVPGVFGTTATRLKAAVKSGNSALVVDGKPPKNFPAPIVPGRSPGSFVVVCACRRIPKAHTTSKKLVRRAQLNMLATPARKLPFLLGFT